MTKKAVDAGIHTAAAAAVVAATAAITTTTTAATFIHIFPSQRR